MLIQFRLSYVVSFYIHTVRYVHVVLCRLSFVLPFHCLSLVLSCNLWFASVYLFVSVPETTGHDFVLITIRGTVEDV